MKLSNDMLFAHPVLAPYSDDYNDALFDCSFEVLLDDETVILQVELKLNCADLERLVDEGAAGTGFFLICPRTYYNSQIEMAPGKATLDYKAQNFFGTVMLQPVVWSKESRKGWTSSLLHEEYGHGVDLPEASILAVGEEQRFSVDRDQLKPFETIFALAESDEVPPGQFKVDTGEAKITIYACKETKASIEEMRGVGEAGRSVILNSIYLPAISEVLRQLGDGDGQLANQPWFRIFTAKCDAAGINPETCVPLEAAQQLLNSPFLKIDTVKEDLF
ncbi:hypothetical protein [Altererythrobacter rubellus]|uniref:Uncharacterized protein n=1 Tax=Altererythrobacter rubellus TaxID=2173831 RepID=A0A9Y2B4Z0_9SPHN|nr:hypothetical protein [Altererythrobacter rubellus]WIW95464.1 hypothetical protein QQX03_11100 [Altererythrobacter rubellus]